MSAAPIHQEAPVVGIDLGGTKIRSVVTDAAGTILGEDVRPTDAEQGQEIVVGRLVDRHPCILSEHDVVLFPAVSQRERRAA